MQEILFVHPTRPAVESNRFEKYILRLMVEEREVTYGWGYEHSDDCAVCRRGYVPDNTYDQKYKISGIAIHYLSHHSEEIPESEISKLDSFFGWVTVESLRAQLQEKRAESDKQLASVRDFMNSHNKLNKK